MSDTLTKEEVFYLLELATGKFNKTSNKDRTEHTLTEDDIIAFASKVAIYNRAKLMHVITIPEYKVTRVIGRGLVIIIASSHLVKPLNIGNKLLFKEGEMSGQKHQIKGLEDQNDPQLLGLVL